MKSIVFFSAIFALTNLCLGSINLKLPSYKMSANFKDYKQESIDHSHGSKLQANQNTKFQQKNNPQLKSLESRVSTAEKIMFNMFVPIIIIIFILSILVFLFLIVFVTSTISNIDIFKGQDSSCQNSLNCESIHTQSNYKKRDDESLDFSQNSTKAYSEIQQHDDDEYTSIIEKKDCKSKRQNNLRESEVLLM